jgi:2-oxoglutarate/2-oxoacid ferredoxin oxidoreductase subunit alpha
MQNRTVIKIAGESGMGIESTGMIVMKSLKNLGYNVYGEREFNSIIKGGRANIQINFSHQKVRSMSNKIDIGVAVDREGVLDCLETLKEGGILIHGFERWPKIIKNLPQIAKEKKLQVILVPAREIALSNGGNVVMTNVVLLGFLWKVLGLDLQNLKDQIAKQFLKKPDLVPINFACSQGGYDFEPSEEITFELKKIESDLNLQNKSSENQQNIIIDGNSAIGIGAINSGVRAYYAYPMSPASSILVYLAKVAGKTGMLVKQLEDEITVAQATIGSMHAGTRALCGTSGGGYDLMTETISLSGMIEVPFVCVVAQRPGPATGLPTWTGQADLKLAINAGHGEFTRCVVACSDPQSCYQNIQYALNIAEKFQIPVTVLTEANIAMSYTTTKAFVENQIPINRSLSIEKSYFEKSQNPEKIVNLDKEKAQKLGFEIVEKLESKDRYKITENGISTRWIPTTSESIYFANGDEHNEDGTLTEEALMSEMMINKRIIKQETLLKELPEPELFGNTSNSKITVVGWGSTKNVVLDALEELEKQGIYINYLHYNFVWPLKISKFQNLFNQKSQKIVLIEGNHEGQFGNLLESKTAQKFDKKLLKWNGRAFFVEEIIDFIKNLNINLT